MHLFAMSYRLIATEFMSDLCAKKQHCLEASPSAGGTGEAVASSGRAWRHQRRPKQTDGEREHHHRRASAWC